MLTQLSWQEQFKMMNNDTNNVIDLKAATSVAALLYKSVIILHEQSFFR
jgi:hypothetical protein